jgi:dihydroflavonol-4-reductase
MKRALVTGGCGFLGSWIVKLLRAEGISVRVLAVRGETRENLEGLDVEILEGDVTNIDDCARAVQGCDTVFHAAAIYADWAPDPTRMYDVNMRGTFHMLEGSRRANVERVIYTASIVSLGRPEAGMLAHEGTAYEAWDIDFPYSRSKYASRELAEYFAAWGLDVRVVCPGIVLGPNDVRPTPSGGLILSALGVPGPATVFEGGASYVDVRDAARVHVLAAQKGRRGERYLATAHNLNNEEFLRAIDRAAGRKRPAIRLPTSLARVAAVGMEQVASRTGRPPLLSRDFFEYGLKPAYYSNRKSIEELGASYRPLEESIRDAMAFFKTKGMSRSLSGSLFG